MSYLCTKELHKRVLFCVKMAEQEKWKWQEPGTTWKGVGLYHITLTIPDRRPLLAMLDIPDNSPAKAIVRRTALGNALVDCLMSVPKYHPEVQVLHFCLMPDHLHAVLYVRHTMPSGIRALVRGFWQAAKKLGRAWSAASYAVPNAIRGNGEEGLREQTSRMEALAASLRAEMGEEAYYRLAPVFTEIPFIRPMVHRSQLPNTIRYIDMNPQRLATKRLKPGFFRVQQGVAIGVRSYYGSRKSITWKFCEMRSCGTPLDSTVAT